MGASNLSCLFDLTLGFFLVLIVRFSRYVSYVSSFFVVNFHVAYDFFGGLLYGTLLARYNFYRVLYIATRSSVNAAAYRIDYSYCHARFAYLDGGFDLFFVLFYVRSVILSTSLFRRF